MDNCRAASKDQDGQLEGLCPTDKLVIGEWQSYSSSSSSSAQSAMTSMKPRAVSLSPEDNLLSGPAQSYQSIDQVELDDDFYSRSKSDTIKALTHASLTLKRMSEQEFHSCDDAFYLSTRNGLILVAKQLTEYVKGVLHAFQTGCT
jgi:hypothetical protein